MPPKPAVEEMDESALRAEVVKLRGEVAELESQKDTYGLHWEDKPEQVEEDCKTKFPVLKEVPKLAITQAKGDLADTPADELPTHLIIEGDNYHALSVLNYTHAGKVDVIYIDPPYNTGAKDWKYNNHYVDGEDTFRHSKWLSFMEKRLKLARNLLSERGFICCAIDHNELFNLGCLMDETFGEKNRAGVITIVHKFEGRLDDKFFATANEYMLVYAKNAELATLQAIELSDEKIAEYNKEDEIGNYKLKQLRRAGSNSNRSDRRNMYFPIYYNETTETFSLEKTENAIEIFPLDQHGNEKCWRWGKDTTQKELHELVYKFTNGRHNVYLKARIENHPGGKSKTFWSHPSYSGTAGTNQVKQILGRGKFNYPKSVYTVMEAIKVTSKPDSVILDFFAGSGTTGHAVSQLNKQDGGSRQFILCTNNENEIARDVCYSRVKSVINGFKTSKQKIANRKCAITDEEIPPNHECFVKGKKTRVDREEVILGEPIPANLRYFETDFVARGENDMDKYALSERAVEMLCIRENTFTRLNDSKGYKLFAGYASFTAIVLLDSAVDACKKAITAAHKTHGSKPCRVYKFSVGFADPSEFDGIPQVSVQPIPHAIMQIYRSVFHRRRR